MGPSTHGSGLAGEDGYYHRSSEKASPMRPGILEAKTNVATPMARHGGDIDTFIHRALHEGWAALQTLGRRKNAEFADP